ncbi:DUF262 domain-containing protein [Myroides odoratimimus]|uniref:DUF262 domain-containing protein n=1 Tax=Myroides odoratimimus TaxID=76832 RepID=UPI00257541A8|nr:DUF262 domain-containing protein [Myroides odoratimimus]MDM1465318.1 DUF262 domain-containing protein [Myroides odoratimimus]MDM1475322.1 DUF262 domain-containing protein [Myroides odoratimimus]
MSIGVKLKSVAELLSNTFFIRSYQRGYRWDKDQVVDLLNDFKDFIDRDNKSDLEFYCLQPIVVKELTTEELDKLDRFKFSSSSIYEVIDGQQRITTITILLNYLQRSLEQSIVLPSLPEIHYEVRGQSREILSNFNHYITSDISSIELDNNIDFYHMKVVYKTISDWFNQNNTYHFAFLKLLTSYKIHSVKVIWYEVESNENSIDVFRRFNIGKISLNNAELIKAIFLKDDPNVDSSIRHSISKEWQEIENYLQSDLVWNFLAPSKKYVSRIEYIFDLLFTSQRLLLIDKEEILAFDNTYGTDKYKVFRYFSLLIDNSTNVLDVWDQVNKIYGQISQWFNNPEHYHYIGYLQNKEAGAKNIVLEILNKTYKTKQELTNVLIESIKKEVQALFFTDHKIKLYYDNKYKQDLRNLFFLINIESYIKLSMSTKQEGGYKLPFLLYKQTQYDIEHIDSLNEKDTSNLNDEQKIEFLKDLEIDFSQELIGFKQILEPLFIDASLEDKWLDSNITKENIGKILESLIEKLDEFLEKEPDQITNKNLIGNLTLLNSSINRSYGNAYFTTKRRCIINEDKEGNFIPLATRNVFLKYYSGSTKKHTRWTQDDANNYTQEIEKILSKFYI